MKTPNLDEQITRLRIHEKNCEISEQGKAMLEEYKQIKKALDTDNATERSEPLKKSKEDILNKIKTAGLGTCGTGILCEDCMLRGNIECYIANLGLSTWEEILAWVF